VTAFEVEAVAVRTAKMEYSSRLNRHTASMTSLRAPDMIYALASLGCGLFAIGLLFSGLSVLFRTGVGLANRAIGASRPDFDAPGDEPDEWIGYRYIKQPVRGIPSPGFGKGLGTVLVLIVVNALAGVAMRITFGVGFEHYGPRSGPDWVACQVMGILFCFPLAAWIVSSILPTSFGRACLVLLTSYLVLAAVGLGLYVLIRAIAY
jgi:hypothetical protein